MPVMQLLLTNANAHTGGVVFSPVLLLYSKFLSLSEKLSDTNDESAGPPFLRCGYSLQYKWELNAVAT